MAWTAQGHEFEALVREPAVCLSPGDNTIQSSVGQALFNAPDLLGGQAARAGVSCASCHTNGRRNAHFYLEGVSTVPGTADISSSFFSVVRANGRFDPTPISDLAMPGKISRDPANGELERFMTGLIVEEFAGREPSRAILAALAAYVRSVRACPDRAVQPQTLKQRLFLTSASIRAAGWMAQQQEAQAAAVLISSARHQLGLVDERFSLPGLARERRMLRAASMALHPIAQARTPDPKQLAAWQQRFEARLIPHLLHHEQRSLYDPVRLSEWVESRTRTAPLR